MTLKQTLEKMTELAIAVSERDGKNYSFHLSPDGCWISVEHEKHEFGLRRINPANYSLVKCLVF